MVQKLLQETLYAVQFHPMHMFSMSYSLDIRYEFLRRHREELLDVTVLETEMGNDIIIKRTAKIILTAFKTIVR